MTGKTISKSVAELQAIARKKAAEVIGIWRAEGLSDADIERKLGQPLPPELRRSPTG